MCQKNKCLLCDQEFSTECELIAHVTSFSGHDLTWDDYVVIFDIAQACAEIDDKT